VECGRGWPGSVRESLLTAHVAAYFFNDVRGSLGPVFDQTPDKERRDDHEHSQSANQDEFHTH